MEELVGLSRAKVTFGRAAVFIAMGLVGATTAWGQVHAADAVDSDLQQWVSVATSDPGPEGARALRRLAGAELADDSRSALAAFAANPAGTPARRSLAVFALAGHGADLQAEAILVELLASERDSVVAAEILRGLGRVGQADAVAPLVERAALKDGARWREREAALLALGTLAARFGPYLPEPAPQVVADALDAGDPGVRWAAAWALSQVPDERTEERLLSMLQSSSETLREAAASALEFLQWSDSEAPLTHLHSSDSSLVVRASLARGLARQSDAASRHAIANWMHGCLLARRASPELDCEPTTISAALQVWLASPPTEPWLVAAMNQWTVTIRERLAQAGRPGAISERSQGHIACLLAATLDQGAGRRTEHCGPAIFGEQNRLLYRIEALRRRTSNYVGELRRLASHADSVVRVAALAALASRDGLTGAEMQAALFDAEPAVGAVAVRYVLGTSRAASRVGAWKEPLRAWLTRRDVRPNQSPAGRLHAALRQIGVTGIELSLPVAAEPEPGVSSPQRATLVTDQGIVELRLRPDWAPQAVSLWVRRADRGEFDYSAFFGVQPAVAAFAGDSRPDGASGDRISFDAEFAPIPVRAGIVGLASTPDGAIAQSFFIAAGDQPELYGMQPVFAEVIGGLDVVRRLTPGDRILHVRLRDASGENWAAPDGAARMNYRDVSGRPGLAQ